MLLVRPRMGNVNSAYTPVLSYCKRYRDVYIIVAPPRSSSTALARAFSRSPSIDYYCHEPFDKCYHYSGDYDSVLEALEKPLVVTDGRPGPALESGLLIKEMTFQVGSDFPTLASLTAHPIVFIIRDPRLCISSRMRKLQKSGDDPLFPAVESGWADLARQIRFCDEMRIRYLVVDSADFRSNPAEIFPSLFRCVGLSFSTEYLSWEPMGDAALGALGDRQRHWYRRILDSTGIECDTDPIPPFDFFPDTNGFRGHVEFCHDVYIGLKDSENLLARE